MEEEAAGPDAASALEEVPAPAAALDTDLIRAIASRSPCRFHRLAMSTGCKRWRTAICNYAPITPVAPYLPLLLVPRGEPPVASCLLCGGARHHVNLPEDASTARYFGSYDGGWVFLALRTDAGHRHMLLNLRSGLRIALPDSTGSSLTGSPGLPVEIHAVALSAAPEAELTDAAALVVVPRVPPLNQVWQLMFWRLGSQQGRFAAVQEIGFPQEVGFPL